MRRQCKHLLVPLTGVRGDAKMHLYNLIDDACVQIARDEACADALDLVGAWGASRDDWRLCWLYRHNLQGQKEKSGNHISEIHSFIHYTLSSPQIRCVAADNLWQPSIFSEMDLKRTG